MLAQLESSSQTPKKESLAMQAGSSVILHGSAAGGKSVPLPTLHKKEWESIFFWRRKQRYSHTYVHLMSSVLK